MSAHYDAQYQKKKIIIIIIDSQYDSIFDNYNAFHTHTQRLTQVHLYLEICFTIFIHVLSFIKCSRICLPYKNFKQNRMDKSSKIINCFVVMFTNCQHYIFKNHINRKKNNQ